MARGRKTEVDCKYRENVVCQPIGSYGVDGWASCASCGWNPAVEERRKREIATGERKVYKVYEAVKWNSTSGASE